MGNKRLIPGPLLIFIDILLTGVALCVFSYFHHVKPSSYVVDVKQIESDMNSQNNSSGESSSDSTNNNNSNNSNEDSDNSSDNNSNNNSDNDSNDNSSDSSSNNGFANFSSKFSDKFSSTAKYTDDSYIGPNSNVTVTKISEDGVTYFVQDIYVRTTEHLRTAFANDSYGKSIADWPVDIGADNDAVCAINGDYYGIHETGLVIRNGYAYRTTLSSGSDLCVIFKNGEMKTYSDDEIDVDQVINDGAYQAWSFGPELVIDGTAMSNFGNNRIASENPRTGIGYYEPGHYCFVTVDGRNSNNSDGLTLKGFASLFVELGCKNAYNLDGGKSSVMSFNDELVNEPCDGGRDSSDIVYIAE